MNSKRRIIIGHRPCILNGAVNWLFGEGQENLRDNDLWPSKGL